MIYNEVLLTRQIPSGNANRHIFCAAGNNKKVSKRRNRATGRRATLPPGGSAGFGYVSRVWVRVWVRRLPHILPHTSFNIFATKKAPKTEVFDALWSCWADSNRRPHPYQEIFDNFYNNFYLFLVIFVTNNVVSRTFEKCSLRCFHICLWWNCGQAAILRIRPLIVKLALRNLGYKVRNHIRCISISYSPDFFTLYTAFFSQYIIECL